VNTHTHPEVTRGEVELVTTDGAGAPRGTSYLGASQILNLDLRAQRLE